MARPVRSDYDNPGQFAQALREYEAANAPVVTPEQTAQIETAAQTAGGFFTGSQQDYIDDLVANRSRPGVQPGAGTFDQRMAALNTLITEGQAKSVSQPDDGSVTPVTPVDPVPGGTRADARNTIRAVLSTYGLGDLSDFLYGVYARGEVNINNPDAIIFAIRGQDAYKKRFAANAARAAKGLAELDPASYVQLENQYRQLLQSNGLPSGFYDQTEDFTVATHRRRITTRTTNPCATRLPSSTRR
jgi:hypothetical protein